MQRAQYASYGVVCLHLATVALTSNHVLAASDLEANKESTVQWNLTSFYL